MPRPKKTIKIDQLINLINRRNAFLGSSYGSDVRKGWNLLLEEVLMLTDTSVRYDYVEPDEQGKTDLTRRRYITQSEQGQ